VLVLIKGLGIGGAERLISEGARFWDRETFDYAVAYVLPWKDQLVADLERRDVPVRRIGDERGRHAFGGLRSLLGEFRPDVVHAHLPFTGILARLASGHARVVYTEHNLPSSYRQPTRLVNRLTYGRNAAVIAVSDQVAEGLARYPGPRPLVIPNGVFVSPAPDARRRIREELGIAEEAPLVVHVGNIRPWKGHRTLIRATAELVRMVPDVVVVSVGVEKNDGDLAALEEERDAAGVGKALRFLGRRADAIDVIAAGDVLVNPSDVEGLPLVVLEAMMLGTPVVATAVGGVPTVIEDGQSGRLVAPGRPDELAAALRDVLTDRAGAAVMAEKAKELVEREHGLERMVGRVEEVYREVLDG